jgi:hypothetical protein
MGGYEVELAMNASINASRASMVVAATPAIARTTPIEGSVDLGDLAVHPASGCDAFRLARWVR